MVRITCINKDNGNHYNPHEAIQQFGWLNEQTSQKGQANMREMVEFLVNGGAAYVVDRNDGSKVNCRVRVSTYGNKYVQTFSNDTPTDNLLNLSECV